MDERGGFLAPGVFFKGQDAARTAAAFLKLPLDFAQRTIVDLPRLNISSLFLQAKSFYLNFRPTPKDLPDLVGTVRSGLDLLETTVAVLAGASPEARHLPKQPSVAPLRCRYCHGWFFPLNAELHCRNCGAPYDGTDAPPNDQPWPARG